MRKVTFYNDTEELNVDDRTIEYKNMYNSDCFCLAVEVLDGSELTRRWIEGSEFVYTDGNTMETGVVESMHWTWNINRVGHVKMKFKLNPNDN